MVSSVLEVIFRGVVLLLTTKTTAVEALPVFLTDKEKENFQDMWKQLILERELLCICVEN